MLTRRQLLASMGLGGAGMLALSGRARAIGPGSLFRMGELVVPGAMSTPRSTAIPRLAREIELRTSIDADLKPTIVPLAVDKLWTTPFLFFAGDRRFTPPSASLIEALRRFLTFGGFLFIDSAEGRAGGEFDASVRQLVAEIFPPPAAALAPLPEDHVLHKSFYLTSMVAGRVSVVRELEAVIHDGRAVVVYSQNDLGGAWAKDPLGQAAFQCYPGGELQREHAFRLGINVAMYALCLDYKTDQVHVPFILKRRRWRVGEP
jgi:hypothetical protein